jgi:hypothetical protein
MRFLGGKWQKKITANAKAIESVASLQPSAERRRIAGLDAGASSPALPLDETAKAKAKVEGDR